MSFSTQTPRPITTPSPTVTRSRTVARSPTTQPAPSAVPAASTAPAEIRISARPSLSTCSAPSSGPRAPAAARAPRCRRRAARAHHRPLWIVTLAPKRHAVADLGPGGDDEARSIARRPHHRAAARARSSRRPARASSASPRAPRPPAPPPRRRCEAPPPSARPLEEVLALQPNGSGGSIRGDQMSPVWVEIRPRASARRPCRRRSPCGRAPCRRRRPSCATRSRSSCASCAGSSQEQMQVADLARGEADVGEGDVLDVGLDVALAPRPHLDRLGVDQVQHDGDVVHAERPEPVLSSGRMRPRLSRLPYT